MPAMRMLDSGLATYSYNITQFNPVASATDVWMLTGINLLKTKVRWLEVGGTVANAGTIRTQPVALIKRSTATSGGTSTTPTPQKADSGDVNAQAVVTQWTTLPGGLGSSIGQIDSTTFTMTQGATTAVPQDRAVFNYEAVTVKPITLNNASEFLCVNFAAVATVASDRIDFEIWWTESTG